MESDTTKIAIIAALAVVTSSVTALNEFTKIFDFAPFWSDLLVALGTMSAAAYLLARARFERIVVARHSALRRIFGAATSYFLPVFIALLGVITIVHPIGNVVHGSWLACGVVETQCGQPRCIRLFDERERQTARECFPLDSSNYFQTSSIPRWNYEPKRLSLRCGAEERATVAIVSALLRNPKCDGKMNLD